jgi:hypothetical protein
MGLLADINNTLLMMVTAADQADVWYQLLK